MNVKSTLFRIGSGLVAAAIIVTLVSIFTHRSAALPAFRQSAVSSVESVSASRPGPADSLIIRFREAVARPELVAKAAFVSPALKGSWSMEDDRTVKFTPDSPMKSGTAVKVAVDTGLLAGKAAGAEGCSFTFTVRPAVFECETEGLYAEDAESSRFTLSGTVSADVTLSEKQAAQALSVTLSGGGARVETLFEPVRDEPGSSAVSARWRFTVRGIERGSEARTLSLSWNGRVVGSPEAGTRDWLVPGREDFRVLEIAATEPTRIQVRFSDGLDRAQDLRGLVSAGTGGDIRYTIDSNVLSLFNPDGWNSDADLTVREGIRSGSGKVLSLPAAMTVRTAWEIPAVRFPDDGVILPTTQGVIVPVETKNLKGLIVEAYRIFGDNVLQFLQNNELDGKYELRRVGEPIWSDAIEFAWDDGMKNRWVTRGLDLSRLVKDYPGGMFQLRATFRHRHIMYECGVNHQDFSSYPMPDDSIAEDSNGDEESYWDYWGDMDWKKRQTYWSYRNDPCHPAFYLTDYHREVLARKNVLVSDLGMMAKKDADGTYRVTVANIGTTEPVNGAEVSLYSYAQRKLVSAVTGKDGAVILTPGAEPYFMAAVYKGQTSWLRIDAGTSLSVSHFKVDGVKAEKGIKGFIYGERGVWRPGDDIHLVFLLQDLEKKLPSGFPVTFELEDPMGRIARTGTYTESLDGFYRIDTATQTGDPTGKWTARVRAGGQAWTETLRVEAIIPNRLAINLKTADPMLKPKGNKFTLSGEWLHGAPAPGLKADVSAIFLPGSTTFDGYADYVFTNPERSVESEQETVWSGYLGQDSAARFDLDLYAGDTLPGKLKARLITRVFEPSGLFSIEQANYDYSPYERYVGLKLPKGDAARGMLLTDTKHRVDLALLGPDGTPVRGTAEVALTVYKLEWKWWWEKDALTDATYVSGRSAQRVASGTATVKNGRGSWEFEVKYPDWGRYLVVATDASAGGYSGGHSAAKVVYVDWPGWAGRGQEGGTGSAAMLPLTADKEGYSVGDTAVISFDSSAGGRALVTVEKNGAVLDQAWVETKKGTTAWKLPISSGMAPNAYVHVTLLQPHLQTANSLPIRLYGVIPVMVDDSATKLSPAIDAPAAWEPGKRAAFTVSEASGRAMTYTVAVVDEGLLGLTRYSAPNPRNEFYKKEASRLISWDIYRYVMSAFGGKLETLLSIGGSEEILGGNNKKTERFKPVVQFFGPYRLEPGKKNATEFDMPNYVGAVRVMVVAGRDGAYGVAERQVKVKSELMVLKTLPRTLGANESIDIPVTTFNGSDRSLPVTVSLSSTGSIDGTWSQTVTVPALSDATVSFTVKTAKAGVARFTAKAATTAIAVSDDPTDIEILSRGSPTATTRDFTLAPGNTWRNYVPSPGEKGSKTITAELSTLPVLDLDTRLRYLLGYPHGCIEQITSGGFPQLYAPSMIALSPTEAERVKENVRSVLDRYPSYQTAGGGFAYWPGQTEENEWGTTYAGHFMVEARRAGYEVSDDLFKPWLARQQTLARDWQPAGDKYRYHNQAYRLYTLALAGYADIGAMNRLASLSGVGDAALWQLAAAYGLAGHRQTASGIAGGLAAWPGSYRDTGNTWGSDLRDAAIALRCLADLGDSGRAADLVPKVARSFADGRWYSTQETSWMVMALAPWYAKNESQETTWSIDWDRGTQEGTVGKQAAVVNLEAFESPTQTMVVKNTGKKALYGRVTTRGMLPPGQETEISDGIGLTVAYLDPTGAAIPVSAIRFGDSFTVRVTVRNNRGEKIENLALDLPVPTAWEFGNARVGDTGDGDAETALGDSAYDWRDIRDTRVSTYFSLDRNESKTFTFHATQAYSGDYYVPAVRAEAMYDASIQGVVPGAFVAGSAR